MKTRYALLALAAAAALLAACGTTPNTGTPNDRQVLRSDVQAALADFKNTDASLQQRLDQAEAYAIFPKIVGGAVGIGGAHGNGEVFQHGRLIGYADVSQGNIGLQLGGETLSELVLFQNQSTLDTFEQSAYEFDAKASAVVAADGAASSADYSKGVLVFTRTQSGAMLQAAVGGQKFRYTPIGNQ